MNELHARLRWGIRQVVNCPQSRITLAQGLWFIISRLMLSIELCNLWSVIHSHVKPSLLRMCE